MPTNVAELVAQLPATDKEAESKGLTPSKFTGPAPAELRSLVDKVLTAGPEGMNDLIGLIIDRASPDYKSYRAEYLLHGIVLAAGEENQAARRKQVAIALASRLNDDKLSPYTRGFLVRELQWCGTADEAGAIGKLLTDKQFCEDAIRTLLAIGGAAANDQLRQAYPMAEAECKLPLLHALAAAGDVKSAGTFRQVLGSDNVVLALIAGWGAVRIADAEAASGLLKLAELPASADRDKAVGLCMQLAEKLIATRPAAATDLYQKLKQGRNATEEKVVLDAIERALAH